MYKVFVYGTLKKGFANHGMLEDSVYEGRFETTACLPLVVGGPWNSPYLLDKEGAGSRVVGELYHVTKRMLKILDDFENVGTNYTRKELSLVPVTDEHVAVEAFAYLKCNYTPELLASPTCADYQCRRYVPRHLRT